MKEVLKIYTHCGGQLYAFQHRIKMTGKLLYCDGNKLKDKLTQLTGIRSSSSVDKLHFTITDGEYDMKLFTSFHSKKSSKINRQAAVTASSNDTKTLVMKLLIKWVALDSITDKLQGRFELKTDYSEDNDDNNRSDTDTVIVTGEAFLLDKEVVDTNHDEHVSRFLVALEDADPSARSCIGNLPIQFVNQEYMLHIYLKGKGNISANKVKRSAILTSAPKI